MRTPIESLHLWRISRLFSVAGMTALVTLSIPSQATVTVFAYVEPGCPQAGDIVTLKEAFKPTLPNLVRQGNTFRVTYSLSDGSALFPQNSASASLGALQAGTYTVELATSIGGVFETFDFVVGSAPINHTGAWYQPTSSGHGLALFRGTRTIAGSFYSYVQDNKPTWLLMQTAHCTSTGYRGALWQYFGQHWSVTDRPAQDGLQDKPPPTILGTWRFESSVPNAGILTYQLPPGLILTNPPGVTQLTTTVRAIEKLQLP
jgi:hypothetical protein